MKRRRDDEEPGNLAAKKASVWGRKEIKGILLVVAVIVMFALWGPAEYFLFNGTAVS